VTVVSVDARPHDDPEEIRDLLIRQIVSPVRWEDCCATCSNRIREFYEVGPGVLRGLPSASRAAPAKADGANYGGQVGTSGQ
jgi:malonyl CoA-acyl carrier protein transacylase